LPQLTCNRPRYSDSEWTATRQSPRYMDYVDDDSMCMFTTQQMTRMQAALDGARSQIGT